ncbi:Diuretic hormone 41 [Eumeta japonica]|uniref:Diuretic hormone 41 n=1 Tax=Eumeta variegata TaxID=151549 RepID=A0A4C1U965_EUMVA|nr:Diuretic hormone 41 [Eumeta japonica]
MWWAMWCCAAAAAVCARAAPPALPAIELAQIDQSAPDDQQDALSYVEGPLAARYAPEPWLYLLAGLPRDSQRALRNGTKPVRLRRETGSIATRPILDVNGERYSIRKN